MSKLLVSAAALVAVAGVASAKTQVDNYVLWADGYKGVTTDQLSVGTSRTGQAVPLNVAGIGSWDSVGSASNEVRTINVGPGGRLTGVAWDVNITAFDPSWASEIAVLFGSTSAPQQINLRVGASNNPAGTFPNAPGTGSFASGGIVKFADVGLPDIVADADGIIRLEFFESFDDGIGVQDGQWNSGSLILQVVPTPGAAALFGVAGLAAARRRRA